MIESAAGRGKRMRLTAITLCELVRVLESAYDQPRADVARALEQIVRTADFADALIGLINEAAGCALTLTFDRSLKRNDPFDTPIAPDGHLVPDALVEPKGILCCHAPITLLMNWKPETKK